MRKLELMLPEGPSAGAPRTRAVQGTALLRLAHATIGLSQVAPRLAELAAARQEESERQAERAKDVAALARQMSTALGHTVGLLRTASGEIAQLTELIRRIAEETSLIAINTGVAAARAGDDGKVFTVLAREIRALSDDTAAAARDVEGKIRRLQDSADRTARVVGLDAGARRGDHSEGPGLAWLLERMAEAEASASAPGPGGGRAHDAGARAAAIGRGHDPLGGSFRLDAHRRAEALLEQLRANPELCSGDSRRQARALRSAIEEGAFVELAYATNLRGIQRIENVARRSFSAAYGDSGAGKDWSNRPWFRGALRCEGVYSSEIYRSAATDEFCLTVSATFGPRGGAALGVVAMDCQLPAAAGG